MDQSIKFTVSEEFDNKNLNEIFPTSNNYRFANFSGMETGRNLLNKHTEEKIAESGYRESMIIPKLIIKQSLEAPGERVSLSSRRRYSPVGQASFLIAGGSKNLEASESQKIRKNEKKKAREIELIVKQKQSRISFLILVIGKILGILRRTRQRMEYQNLANLRPIQFEFINDMSYFKNHYNKLRAQKEKRTQFARLTSTIRAKNKEVLTKMLSKIGLPELDLVRFSLKIRKKIKKYLIIFHPFNKMLVFWKAVFCLLLTFEIYSMTIKLFFEKNWDQSFLEKYKYDQIMVFLMIIEIFIKLNTAIYTNGIMSTSRKKIFMNYLKTECIYDVTSILVFSIPIRKNIDQTKAPGILNSSEYLFKLIFLIKIKQIRQVFYYFENVFNMNELWDGIFSLGKLFAQVAMCAHIIACCWNVVGMYNYLNGVKSWYDGFFTSDELSVQTVWLSTYIHSIYWSIMTMITVGYGDISAKNSGEMLVAILGMLFGCGFFAYAINNIGLIIEKINMKRKNLRKDLRIFKKFMKRNHLDYGLQIKVFKYLEHIYLEEESENRVYEKELLNKLSSSLKREIQLKANCRILSDFKNFSQYFTQETMEKISLQLESVNYAPEEIIFKEGDRNDQRVFFIVKGEVELDLYTNKGRKKEQKTLKILKEGEFFGQLGLFGCNTRNITAVSRGFSSIYFLRLEDFLETVKEKEEDYETFCYLRDDIFLYEDFNKVGIYCEFCEEKSHILNMCPYLNYRVNRDLVLRQHLHSNPNERSPFRRKSPIKTESALLTKNCLQNLAPPDIQYESQNSMMMSAREESVMGRDQERLSGVVDEDTDSMGSSVQWRGHTGGLLKKEQDSKEFEKITEEGVSDGEEKHDEIFLKEHTGSGLKVLRGAGPKRSWLHNGKKTSVTKEISLTKEVLQIPYQKEQKSSEPSEFPQKPELPSPDINMIFGGINSEKMHNFTLYYPYNNCDAVVGYINKKRKKTKKLLSKINFSVFRGVKRSVMANGLIDFQNQKLFYLNNLRKRKKVSIKHI